MHVIIRSGQFPGRWEIFFCVSSQLWPRLWNSAEFHSLTRSLGNGRKGSRLLVVNWWHYSDCSPLPSRTVRKGWSPEQPHTNSFISSLPILPHCLVSGGYPPSQEYLDSYSPQGNAWHSLPRSKAAGGGMRRWRGAWLVWKSSADPYQWAALTTYDNRQAFHSSLLVSLLVEPGQVQVFSGMGRKSSEIHCFLSPFLLPATG